MPRLPPRCPACGLAHADHEVRCPLTGRPLEGTSDLPPSLALAASQATGRRRALLGRVLQGKYRPTSVIAEGGMGTVYEAEHLPSGRLVAIKALDPAYAGDPDVVRRFRREARSVRSIGHPNICAIHEVGRLDDGAPYLVMERLRGETLADRLEREGALPLADALGVARQVLGALGAAHDKGVVHRDVKPDNIFLVAEGRGPSPAIKLLDFGLSKAEGDDARLSYDGAIVGTPLYMAPEQALGESVDHRADLWAVGVVLYESLTGRCPFVAFNYGALLRLVASEEPRLVRALRPSLPEAIERLVCRALAKRPADRFQTAREFRAAIAARSADAWGGRPAEAPAEPEAEGALTRARADSLPTGRDHPSAPPLGPRGLRARRPAAPGRRARPVNDRAPFASAHRLRPKAGEIACGDAALVRRLGPARTLFALFDALGHGPQAAHASAIALATLGACDDAIDLPALVDRVHADLRGSRGAAALIGIADGHALRACIVGNVELRTSRNACAGIVHSPGVLGVSIRKLRFFDGALRPDDRLIAFSDGVSSRLVASDLEGLGPDEACAYALERFGTSLDDASVLVLDALP